MKTFQQFLRESTSINNIELLDQKAHSLGYTKRVFHWSDTNIRGDLSNPDPLGTILRGTPLHKFIDDLRPIVKMSRMSQLGRGFYVSYDKTHWERYAKEDGYMDRQYYFNHNAPQYNEEFPITKMKIFNDFDSFIFLKNILGVAKRIDMPGRIKSQKQYLDTILRTSPQRKKENIISNFVFDGIDTFFRKQSRESSRNVRLYEFYFNPKDIFKLNDYGEIAPPHKDIEGWEDEILIKNSTNIKYRPNSKFISSKDLEIRINPDDPNIFH